MKYLYTIHFHEENISFLILFHINKYKYNILIMIIHDIIIIKRNV